MDTLIPLEESAPLLRTVAGNGQPPKLDTLIRWTQRGKCGVRLHVVRKHGRMWTTLEALGRFSAALAVR